MGQTGRAWKDYKSKLSTQIREEAKGPNSTRHLTLLKPPGMKSNEWDAFVKSRLSPEFDASEFDYLFFIVINRLKSTFSILVFLAIIYDFSYFNRKQVKSIRRLEQSKSIHTQLVVEAMQDLRKTWYVSPLKLYTS